jgi:hypothetical protein
MTTVVMLNLCLIVFAETESTTWTQTYGGPDNENAMALVETSDGGYTLAGTTGPGMGLGGDCWLVRTDATGNMEWNKTYGGPETEHVMSMVATSDGGYAIAGNTGSDFFTGGGDCWLVKTDAYGNMEWNKTYGGDGSEMAFSVIETSDGGYALAGYTGSPDGENTTGFDAENWDVLLVKTDQHGNMEWNQTYGGPEDDHARSLVETSDGGYALGGTTTVFGSTDLWLIKTDAAGFMEWNRTYGGPEIDWAWSLVATSDGGYAIAGITGTNPTFAGDSLLVKTDEFGNVEWSHTYGGPDNDQGKALVAMSDGGFAIAGNTNSSGAGSYDFWLVITDESGDMKWKQTYGGSGIDLAYALVETSDGYYAIAGCRDAFSTTGSDFWLIKTDGVRGQYEYDRYEYDYDFGYFTYTIVVETNSTLGSFDYGLYENQTSFSVTGPTGTTGFCKIVIPEEIVGGNFPVYLNDVMLIEGVDYTRTYNGTHTILDITYNHSTHTIKITGTNLIPEYSSWLLTLLLLTATLVIVVYKSKLFNQR